MNPKDIYKEHGVWPHLCYGCKEYVDALYGDDDSPVDLCLDCYTYHNP